MIAKDARVVIIAQVARNIPSVQTALRLIALLELEIMLSVLNVVVEQVTPIAINALN